MYLSKLTLINVRQFNNRDIAFQPGFNLLVGENGAGKTTLLRGLLAALGASQNGGRRPTLEDEDIRIGTKHSEIRADVLLSNDHTHQYHFRKALFERAERQSPRQQKPLVLFYASNEATCSSMSVKRARRVHHSSSERLLRDEEYLYDFEMSLPRDRETSKGRRFGDSRSVAIFVGQIISTFISDCRNFYWRFEPYDCSLLVPDDSKETSRLDAEVLTQARAFAMRYFQEESFTRRKMPFRWPDQSKVILSPGNDRRRDRLPDPRRIWESTELPKEIQKTIRHCSLEVKLAPRILIQRGHGPMRLDQLSDGEKRLFSLFVDIARQLSLRHPDAEIGNGNAIVLIDEIDVHLHPKWQRHIVTALENLFTQCQFIATTHSPFIVQATPAGKVQNIDGSPIGDVADRGIEEIAKKAMDVDGETGTRYIEMLNAAKDYLRALEKAKASSPRDVTALRERLENLSARYARNPAYQAFLELKTDAKLGSGN